ncbi:MAG: branched-chain amino acid ABC transporter substrate-binding protein [Deltaproteobacteria bacterium]|jgi:branched-chain amino acid transport system substrate-binding protein|nr:branched-chain amino acid ABC transporter substrate-binding protein [Deltaproteobacteria bacterium]
MSTTSLLFRSGLARGLAYATLLVFFVLVPSQIEAQEKFRLGFGGALLGNLASYGLSNFHGLEYAVLEINKKGGLLGRQVEIIAEDDSCDPALAALAAKKLLSSGLKYVMGHSCSGATRRALSVYNDKVLVISSSATDNHLTDSAQNPYFFRTIPRDDAQIKVLLGLIKKNKYKKIAILHDKGTFGQSLADEIRANLKSEPNADPQLVVFEEIPTGHVSFEAEIAKIKDTQADAVLWSGYYNDAARLVTQMRQKKAEAAFIGPDSLCDQHFINIAQRAAEGTYCVGHVYSNHNAAAQAALNDHRARYYSQDIGPYFFYAIGAAQALFAALEKTGLEAEFSDVKKRLNEDTVETVMGPVRFDAKGDVIGANIKLFIVRDGHFVEVRQ